MRSGWEVKKLGEVCEYKSGTTISPALEKPNGEILYVKVGDMNIPGNEDYITASSRYVDWKDINTNQIIPSGSIIFPKRGGAIATNKKRRIVLPTIVDLNTMALVPSQRIDNDFLFFWFKQIDLATLSNGTSIPQINNYSFDNVFISYPKQITEQQHIVAILDEVFETIDQAKSNTKKNLQNAKELFQSELNSIFTNKGEGWVEKKLLDVCTLKSGTTVSEELEKGKGEIAYLKVADMNFVGNENRVSTSSRFLYKRDISVKNIFPIGTIIFPKRGGAIATNKKRITDIPICADLNIMGAIALPIIDSEFLFYFFKKFNLIDIANGTTILQINNYSFEPLTISYPKSLVEQKHIVNQLDTLSIETKQLEENYRKKLESLEELKKSILQKAFSGELTSPEEALNGSDGMS